MPPAAAWASIESTNDEGLRGVIEGSVNKLIGAEDRDVEVTRSLKLFLGFSADKRTICRNVILLQFGGHRSPQLRPDAAARHVNCPIQGLQRVYARAHRGGDISANRGNPEVRFGTSIATKTGNQRHTLRQDRTSILMNRRLLTILVCAFLVAGGCTFLVYRMIGARLSGVRKAATVRVVSAATDIKLGTILKASDLSTTEIAGALPKGAILKPEMAVDRGVVADISQGEPILESRLAIAGSGGGLAATIRKGMRACAVKVDEVVGVAGFVTPGMRVDVLVAGEPPGHANDGDGAQVRTVLQNIEVLSAGTDIQKNADGKAQPVKVVNLLVTPEQAQVLSLASNLGLGGGQGHIQLVLRNPLDTEVAQVVGTGVAQLFSNGTPSPVRPQPTQGMRRAPKLAPAVYSIEVYNGAQRSEQKFAVGEGKQ
jgi:pilus assembly protein CpaB